MRIAAKNFLFACLLAVVTLSSPPSRALGGMIPLEGILTTLFSVACLAPTLIGLIPSTLSQQQVCHDAATSSCCDIPETHIPALPTSCTDQGVTATVCPTNKTLYCPGANVAAQWEYRSWALPVGGLSAGLVYAGSITATVLFLLN